MIARENEPPRACVLVPGLRNRVCGLWAYEGLYAGFYSETGLIYPSETQDWWQAFFYVDPQRKFTSTFYHLSYLIADALGIRGSYVSYQVVYALLWFGRAAFTFLIVREIFPGAARCWRRSPGCLSRCMPAMLR